MMPPPHMTEIVSPEDKTADATRRIARVAPLIVIAVITLLIFGFYLRGLSRNPPGFYVDESAIAYNAYCIASSGRNEFGTRFPLIFPVYTGGWTQYANPTQVYLLAIPFTVLRPSINVARVWAAAWVFAACILLGFLAWQITQRKIIAILLALFAIFTPWIFEVSRLVMETFFYPMAVVLFLMTLYAAQKKESWSWLNVGLIAATLSLLTYSYTIGRLLGPLLAGGLVLFITSQTRLTGVLRTCAVYALTLFPLFLFRARNPGALTQRFYAVSYIKPDSSWSEVASMFIRRFLEDLSVISLLFDGDINARHHVPHSLGSFLIGVFILALIGLFIIIVRHWRDAWWRFVIFGAAASIVPGALTADQFHSLRLVAYPIFLLLLTVPGLMFLLQPRAELGEAPISPASKPLSYQSRRQILFILVVAAAVQATYFQVVYRYAGQEREAFFDAGYRDVYHAAVMQPNRPIYLVDGIQPAYVHALWYATIEGRPREEFIHLEEGVQAPSGAYVIGSEPDCAYCEVILKSGDYVFYRAP